MHHWTDTALGHYLLDWEQQRCDEAVADIFGYHAVQLGMPALQGLRANRMPQRWLALDKVGKSAAAQAANVAQATDESASKHVPPALVADATALPFSEASLDLVLMPHTLETSHDPHAALREAARVLVPEGRLVVCGLNTLSLLGLQRRVERSAAHLPDLSLGLGYWRLRDWLQLLGFEIEAVQFGCYRPATQNARWLARWQFMEKLGHRCWPAFGGVYCIVAVKRVQGMRLISPSWRSKSAPSGVQMPVANKRPGDAAWCSDEFPP
ncbi:MAG: class I SAM-dependent methyltransferase [Comamonas sp.]